MSEIDPIKESVGSEDLPTGNGIIGAVDLSEVSPVIEQARLLRRYGFRVHLLAVSVEAIPVAVTRSPKARQRAVRAKKRQLDGRSEPYGTDLVSWGS